MKTQTSITVVHPDGHCSGEPIPGAYDRSTLTHREPGAMSGRPNGGDIPPAWPDWEDEVTRHEHEREGGGLRMAL